MLKLVEDRKTRKARTQQIYITMDYKLEDEIVTYQKFFLPNILVAVTTIVSNSILIYALRKRSKLVIITFKLIYVLSTADVLSGIAIMVGNVVLKLKASRKHYSTLIKIVRVFLYPLTAFTTLMILLIAVDRCLHMTKPHKYSRIMTHRKANILVTGTAILTVCGACIMGMSYYYNFYAEFLTTKSVVGLFSMVLVFVLYHKALRSVTSGVQNRNLATKNRNIRNVGREASKAVFLILTCLLLTVTPFLIFAPLPLYMPDQKWTLMAQFTSEAIFYCNSSLNAIIIIYFSRDLRSCVRQLFVCSMLCHGEVWCE